MRWVLVLILALGLTTPAFARGGRADWALGREMSIMQGDARVSAFVQNLVAEFRVGCSTAFSERTNMYATWFPRWSVMYSRWDRFGFQGGFHFPLRPVRDLAANFWNPFVAWLWADAWDDHYYETWYGSEWYSAPVLRTPFARPGVFYPTEALRDLAQSASMLAASEQGFLKLGLNDLVNKLQLTLTARLPGGSAELARGDVVVTNAQLLEGGVALDGFVGNDDLQFGFKTLLGFDDVSQNLLFVPTGVRPTSPELSSLSTLNERIRQAGGVVEAPSPGAARRGR